MPLQDNFPCCSQMFAVKCAFAITFHSPNSFYLSLSLSRSRYESKIVIRARLRFNHIFSVCCCCRKEHFFSIDESKRGRIRESAWMGARKREKWIALVLNWNACFVFHFKSFSQRGLNKQLARTPRAKLTMQSISIIALFGCKKPYGSHNCELWVRVRVFIFLYRI